MDPVLARALEAIELSYSPYSKFRVGAALVTDAGAIFGGCNVENASFGATMCAERVALFSARASGDLSAVRRVVLVSDADKPVTPCGLCRQVLFELAPDAVVECFGRDGSCVTLTVKELMPSAFAL